MLISKKKEEISKKQRYIKYFPHFTRKWLKVLKKIIREIIYMPLAYLISYPKTGRTWLRVLIGKSVCEKFNLSNKLILQTYDITKYAGLHRLRLTHDHTSFTESYKFNQLYFNKRKYAGKKIIFLIRNIKDTLVSCYFHATKRDKVYCENISKFIRNDRFGVKKILTFYNIWYENRRLPKDFLLLKYEDLHENPRKVLIQTLHFLGLRNIENNIIEKAIEFASFNHMKKMEILDTFKNKIMTPIEVNDNESYKVRRGIVGGYISYLNENDIQYIDNVINEMECPFDLKD